MDHHCELLQGVLTTYIYMPFCDTGMALGCAEIGAVLFGTDSGLTYYPQDPQVITILGLG